MSIKIGGDLLALDGKVRKQIEAEMRRLESRFPDERIEAEFKIQEEFDQLNGHRVRCELSARFGAGRQILLRDACKKAAEAIRHVFDAAPRSIRQSRRQTLRQLNSAVPATPARTAHIASG